MPRLLLIVTATCALVALLQAQAPPAEQVAQERAQAEIEIPKLVEVLTLKRSMTVADVGAGFGAMTVVLAKWLVTGRVLATDINPGFLAVIRDYVKREGLSNVTLIEGASASTSIAADYLSNGEDPIAARIFSLHQPREGAHRGPGSAAARAHPGLGIARCRFFATTDDEIPVS